MNQQALNRCIVGHGINDAGVCKIALTLKVNSTLTSLDLSDNPFGEDGAKLFLIT